MTRQNLLIVVLSLSVLGTGIYSFLFVDFRNSRYDSLGLLNLLQEKQYSEFATRTKFFFGLSCADNLTPSALSSKLQHWLNRPDYLKLIALLEDRQYDKLTKLILQREVAYEKDITKETNYELSIRALANDDPENEALLTEWVQQQPDHHIPYLVRGNYYVSVGYRWRSSASAGKTSEQQFEKFRFYHQKAYTDFMQSIALKPTVVAYSELISLSSSVLRESVPFESRSRENFVKEGLALVPASYKIRKSYLFKLMPQWGGSYEQIAAFLEDTQQYLDINPALKPLLGFEDYARAFNLNLKGKYNEAIAHYTKALSFGEKAWFRRQRGNIYSYWNYDRAMCDFDRAIALWPQDHDALVSRGRICRKLGLHNRALVDFELASQLKPYDSYTHSSLAMIYSFKGRFQDAVDRYQRALFYGSHKASTWAGLGYTFSYKLKDYKEAAKAYKQATKLKPVEPVYWYEYGVALDKLRDCKVIPVFHTYLSLCEVSNDNWVCADDYQKWVTDVSDFLVAQDKYPSHSQAPINSPDDSI